MRNITRIGAAAATLAVAGLAVAPAPSASAAAVMPAHHHGHDHDAAAPLGRIVICNHSGYMFNVYADGPSIREDDLAGSFDECTDWAKVLTGGYKIGFGLRIPSTQNVIIQARYKRDDHVYYKVFNNQGILDAFVNQGEVTRIDLFIPQG